MCYANPAKSLQIARERMTAEQWARFEREFDDFCVVQGLPDKWAYWPTYDWAKLAFLQGRQHRDVESERPFAWFQQVDDYVEFVSWLKTDQVEPPTFPLYNRPQYWTKEMIAAVRADAKRLHGKLTPGRMVDDAHYERLAIAMMTNEQAEASLERWRGVKGEVE